jgi:hypothetical protein
MNSPFGRHRHEVGFVSEQFAWLLLFILTAFACSRQPEKILFEFKQQPEESYVYRITDHVEWEIEDANKRRYSYQHDQEQKSEMRIDAIDSIATRSLTMSFVVTKDTIINAPDFAWQKKRGSIIGHSFAYQLRMRKNGEIVAVESDDPKEAFFFDRYYKPSQPVFPDRAIAPGYSWTQNFQIAVPDGNPTVATTQYQFTGFAKADQFECAIINFEAALEYTESMEQPNEKLSAEFFAKKYHSQVTSKGQLFFAYREGFLVKKINLITSTARSTTFTKDKVECQSQTLVRDHEMITLTEIHRPGGGVVRYQIQ